MAQISTMSMMKAMIPISRFNRGEANRIFEEVEEEGIKIVVKNNKPACVLLSPGQYKVLIEMASDYMLYLEAERRMEHYQQAEAVSHEEVLRDLGITREDLDEIDVELE